MRRGGGRQTLVAACVALAASRLASSPAHADPAATPPAAPAPAGPAPAPLAESGYRLRGGPALFAIGAHNLLRTSYLNVSAAVPTSVLEGDDDLPAELHFSFAPRLAIVETPEHWAWVGTRLGFTAPLTEPRDEVSDVGFHDLPVSVGYNYTFVERANGVLLLAGPRASLVLPTSEASGSQGIHAWSVLGLGAHAHLPLSRGEWLNALFVSASASWRHLFSRATTAVSDSLQRPRTNAAGGIFLSDQLSGRGFVRDQLVLQLQPSVNVLGDLSFGTGFGVGVALRDSFENDGCVELATGCVSVDSRGDDATTTFVSTSFSLSLGYPIADLVWLTTSYWNVHSITRNDSRSSFFHGPAAGIGLSATLLLDRTYAVLRGRSASTRIGALAPPRP